MTAKQKRIINRKSTSFGCYGRRNGRKTAANNGVSYPSEWQRSKAAKVNA